jgi:four helix bundle protein
MRNTEGYRNLVVWKNASQLRRLIYNLASKFPVKEFRRVSQMNDAARSIKQNMAEGYPKSTLEFIHALTISQGSLKELQEDIDDCLEDRLISNEEFSLTNELLHKTDYLLSKLIDSLRRKSAT